MAVADGDGLGEVPPSGWVPPDAQAAPRIRPTKTAATPLRRSLDMLIRLCFTSHPPRQCPLPKIPPRANPPLISVFPDRS